MKLSTAKALANILLAMKINRIADGFVVYRGAKALEKEMNEKGSLK